jgi:Ser/Thr protein kinase RdoA (MazF antagonist)
MGFVRGGARSRARLVDMDVAAQVTAALPASNIVELAGGHQSRVFSVAEEDDVVAVAKVVDSSTVDRAEFDARLDVIESLADLDPRVCRPMLLGDRRVTELTSPDGRTRYLVLFEFAPGSAPDPARASDARRMGAALSQLHLSMSQVPDASLPVVGALRTVPPVDAPESGDHQLLHGDFNASNLRFAGPSVRIFDLDDCGYGPPAFDIANALYMVLFDACVDGNPAVYETFRTSFVDGYVGDAGSALPMRIVDRFIDLRVHALGSWLDDLDNAPIGIRTASAEWQATLRSFVSAYRSTGG